MPRVLVIKLLLRGEQVFNYFIQNHERIKGETIQVWKYLILQLRKFLQKADK